MTLHLPLHQASRPAQEDDVVLKLTYEDGSYLIDQEL